MKNTIKLLSVACAILICTGGVSAQSGENRRTREKTVAWLEELFKKHCAYRTYIISPCGIRLPDEKNRAMSTVLQTKGLIILTEGKHKGQVQVKSNEYRKVLHKSTDSQIIMEINAYIYKLSTFCDEENEESASIIKP